MHYVDHGPPPDFLLGNPNEFGKAFRGWNQMLLTEKCSGEGNRVHRSMIGKLRLRLAQRFGQGAKSRRPGGRDWSTDVICGYCEITTDTKRTRPEIDHFRPRNHHDDKYKHLTFVWDNLMYVCHPCNDAKGDKFPHRIGGYISPADPDCGDYFEYNFATYKICLNRQFANAGVGIKERVARTIRDFDLNRIELINARTEKKLEIDNEFVKIEKQRLSADLEGQRKRKKIKQYTKQTLPLSSFIVAYGQNLGLLETTDARRKH